MLKVFICEDNKEHRERFSKFIDDIIMIENLDMDIGVVTESPYEIIKYIKENNGFGIYFLDVDLKSDINGIQLAEQIREYDPRGFIIFITTHAEMSYLTFIYKVEAMDYIIKDNYDNVRNRIHQCILNASKKYSSNLNENEKIFTVKSGEKLVNIELDKILFFETSSIIHKIIIHAVDRQVEFYAQMKEIEKKLDDRFYRCHRSYMVNKNNIKEIDKKNRIIYMINGEKCLISTRGMKGF